MTGPFWTIFIALIAFVAGLLLLRAILRRHHRSLLRLPDDMSIDRSGMVNLGGLPQWVSIRGRDRSKPILLFLHGGPGAAFSGIAYSYQSLWEEYFTVVNWDQRGCGRSRQISGKPVTLETLLSDADELIDHLREEFKQEKIFLLGHSWGGFLGITIAHRSPEKLHALIGLAPLLGIRAGYREMRRVLTEVATSLNEAGALHKLKNAPPDLPDAADPAFLKTLGSVVGLLPAYGMSWHNQTSMKSLFARIFTFALISPDLPLRRILQPLGGSRSYVLELFREIQHLHLPDRLGTRFETPIILISGEYDQQAPFRLVREYFDQLEAPYKSYSVLRGSAHAALWEAPGQILEILTRDALPLAGPGRSDQ